MYRNKMFTTDYFWPNYFVRNKTLSMATNTALCKIYNYVGG
jgi:hypothetical protein